MISQKFTKHYRSLITLDHLLTLSAVVMGGKPQPQAEDRPQLNNCITEKNFKKRNKKSFRKTLPTLPFKVCPLKANLTGLMEANDFPELITDWQKDASLSHCTEC